MADGRNGWQVDQFGMHELRFYADDGRPTRLVSDGGRESYDALPSSAVSSFAPPQTLPTPEPAPEPAPESSPSPPAWFSGPPDPQGVPQAHTAGPTGARSSGAPPRHGWWQAQDGEWYPPELHPSYSQSVPAPPPAAPAPPAPPTATVTPSRSRVRRPITVAAALVTGGLVIVAGVVVGTHGSGSGSNADAAVVNAVTSAIGDKTAHITITSTVDAASETVKASGTGSADLTDNSLEATLVGTVDGQQESIKTIYLGGTAYESLPQISQVAPGKSWISLDLSSLEKEGTQEGLGGNPLANLRALALQGNTVSDLGSTTIDGQSAEGYGVTFSPSVLQNEMDKANLPAWMKQALAHVTVGGASTKVYIDSAGRLVRETTAESESVASITVTTSESVDFSDYGAPVSITAPEADQVVPISQFLNLSQKTTTD
jgi:hypothetical protein